MKCFEGIYIYIYIYRERERERERERVTDLTGEVVLLSWISREWFGGVRSSKLFDGDELPLPHWTRHTTQHKHSLQ